MLLIINVILFATITTQNALCIKALQSYRQALEQICNKGSSVASVKWRPCSFKKIVALEPIGPNESKARGKKWYVVESSAYLDSFLVAASSVAAAVVIDVDAK